MIFNLPGHADSEGKIALGSLCISTLRMAFEEGDPDVVPKVWSTVGTIVLLVDPLPPFGIAEFIGLAPEEVTPFLTPQF